MNRKVIIGYDSFNRQIHKRYIKMSQCFPKPYKSFGGNINIKVDLSNYATKAELRNARRFDTSTLAAKSKS